MFLLSQRFLFLAKFGHSHRAFSLTWLATMLIDWNKKKCLHKERVELTQHCGASVN